MTFVLTSARKPGKLSAAPQTPELCDTWHVSEQPTQLSVRATISWRDEDLNRLQVLAANQFAVQLSNEADDPVPSVLLTVGYVAPPLLLGTPEERQTAAAAVENVNVQPLARFSISAKKAVEFAGVLQSLVQQIEAGRQQT